MNLGYLKLSDFTKTPGGRYRKDGKFSAEEWRDDYIIPAAKIEPLVINLDGTEGIAASFLEEVFGGFVRKQPYLHIYVISNENPSYAEEARQFMLEVKLYGD